MAEAGLAGYEAALWVSFVMPSASPPTIIARLNGEVNEIHIARCYHMRETNVMTSASKIMPEA